MLQVYQGYFRDEVCFYENNRTVTLPTNKRVIISILDDESKHPHISLKERLSDFNEEYTFEEWDTGADVGIEVVQ